MNTDGRCGLRERHLSTGPYYSLGSWLCLDRGSVNSGAHLKTEVHEDLLVFTDFVVAVTFLSPRTKDDCHISQQALI